MTFTPGSDDDRTDTYEAQKKLQEDDQTAEEQFNEAQQGLRDANTWFQRTLAIYGALTEKATPTLTSTIDAIFNFNNEDTKKGADLYKKLNPIYTAEELNLNPTGTTFYSIDDPEPLKRKTPTKEEREVRINRWVNDLAFTVDKKKRDGTIVPTHISKLQPKGSGYALLAKAKAEWNQWAKRTGFIRELSDKKMTAFVEHLVGKDKYYDVFWNLPNEQRFRKGSRHGPNNVRILKDNRMKTLKDRSEQILKELLPKPTKDNILLFDYDIPRKANESIIVTTAPRDLLIKRANGTIVGRLGDYHDVLFAPYAELKEKLSTNINPDTGRPYITVALPNGTPLPEDHIKNQIGEWRTSIIEKKLEFIIDMAPTLKGMTKKAKWQYQGSAIEQDMVDFLDKYRFLEPAKGFRYKLKKEPFQSARGGKKIKTQEDKIEGTFLTKTQEREVRKAKYRGRFFSDQIDRILGKDRPEDD
tara:strand:- start:64 stop:1476 length:1413 start_codon:yes stop_codon:yes gene_type:complete